MLTVESGNFAPQLHIQIVRSPSAFRGDPVYVFGRVLDIAGFAVDAVGRIDLQFGLAFLRYHFVNRRGTKILAGISIFADATIAANIWFKDNKVAGLIFFVACAGMIDVGEAIEG